MIKAIETGQGNPTVATMNRIGEFFGLEVAFVPIRRDLQYEDQPRSGKDHHITMNYDTDIADVIRDVAVRMSKLNEIFSDLDVRYNILSHAPRATLEETTGPLPVPEQKKRRSRIRQRVVDEAAIGEAQKDTRAKPRRSQ